MNRDSSFFMGLMLGNYFSKKKGQESQKGSSFWGTIIFWIIYASIVFYLFDSGKYLIAIILTLFPLITILSILYVIFDKIRRIFLSGKIKKFNNAEKLYSENRFTEAFEIYSILANKIVLPENEMRLAECYYNGNGVNKDIEKSNFHLSRAAKKNDQEAQIIYANKLFYGEEIEQNKKEAFAIYKKLQKNGNLYGARSVAYCLINGEGTEKNEKKGLSIIKRLAKSGDMDSQHMLGELLLEGKVTETNTNEAIKYFQKAAEQGNINSMIKLGNILVEGKIVMKDIEKGNYWLNKANSLQDSEVNE